MEPETTSVTLYDANQLPDGRIATIIDKIRYQVSSVISATRSCELLESELLRREREVKLIESSLEEKKRSLEEEREFLEARERELHEKVELFDKERRSFVIIDEEITRKLCEFDEKSEIYEKKESFIEAKEADVRALEADVDNRIVEIRALEKKMSVREKWLKQLSENLGLKDKEIRDRDKELESRISLLSTRELEIEKREKEMTERVQELLSEKISLKDEEFKERDKELESRFRSLSERELEVQKQEIEIKKRVQELELRNNEIVRREKEIELKEKGVEERSKAFDLQNKNRLKELESKEAQLETHRKEVDLEYKKLVDKSRSLDLKEINVEERFKEVDLENKKLLERFEDLKSKEKEVKLETENLLELSENFEFENKKFLDRSKCLESKEKQYIEERKKFEVEKSEFLCHSKEIQSKANRCEELVELKDKQLDEQHRRFEVEKLEFQRQLKEIESKATQFKELLELKNKQFDELHKKLEVGRIETQHQCKEIESMAMQDNELLQKAETNITEFKVQVKLLDSKQKQLKGTGHDLEAEKKKFQEQPRVVESQNKTYLNHTKELESREKKQLDEKGGKADEEEKRIVETHKPFITKESSPKRKRLLTDASVESAVKASSAVASKKLKVSSSSSWPKKNEDPLIKESQSERKEVSSSLEPQSLTGSLMATENGENLKLLLQKHPPPLILYHTLKRARDPAKHVLPIIKEECAFNSTKHPDRFALARCTKLLKQLSRLSPSVAPWLKEAAKEFAFDWRTNLEKKKAHSMEVRCFLQFLASYGLASCFDASQLLTLMDPDQWRKTAADLRQLLGLKERISSFIQSLIEKDQRVNAVKYMHALRYWGKFSAAKLLHEHLNCSLKKHKRNKKKSIGSQMLSMVNEMQEVKEVEKCMADCGIGSKSLSLRVKRRIEQLEKLIEERWLVFEESNGGNQPCALHSVFNDSVSPHTPSSFTRPRPDGGNKHPRPCGPSEFPADPSIGHPGQLPRQHPIPNFVTACLDTRPRHYSLSDDAHFLPYNSVMQRPVRYIRDDFKGEVE